jgi:uncharacterized protein with FMN-binding domain
MDARSLLARLALAVSTIALAAVLLIGFKSPTQIAAAGPRTASGGSVTTGSTGGGSGTTSSAAGGSITGSTPAGTAGPTTGTSTGASTGTKVITGPAVDAFYGQVQVKITVTNGKIVDIKAISLPSGGRSSAISNYVAPILRSEAIQANSANIQLISGATYTSTAYEMSLQAALDQVHA